MSRPPPSLAPTLQAAAEHLRAGRISQAEALLAPHLATGSKDPELYNLAAAVARQARRLADAVALWRRSLVLRSGQPHVHASLGHALRALGDLAGAKRAYEQAVGLSPAPPDAFLGLGLVLETLGQPGEALVALERAVAAAPSNGPAQEALGSLLNRLGRPEEGLQHLDAALRLSPASPTLPHNRGVALEALKRDADAAAAFSEAVTRLPREPAAWFGLANSRRRLGDMGGAIQAYRQALDLAPSFLDAHAELNETIWQAGEGGYLASYPMAIQRLPQTPDLRQAFAGQLNRVRRYDEAEAQARAALQLQPHNAKSLDMLSQALVGQRRFEEAIQSFERAQSLAEGDVRIAGRLAEALLSAGAADRAHDVLQRTLSVAPHDQENLARLTIALRLLGEQQAHAALVDYDRLARPVLVPPPEGFKDTAAFHAALAPYLMQKHLAKQHPTDQTVRGGTQTLGALFDDPDPLIVQLRQRLQEAVEKFVADLPEDRRHPFLSRKSSALRFAGSWSVILRRGGFHTNHIHPEGWISSAYYINVPPEAATSADRQGWFKLGETNPDTSPALAAERWIQPVEGSLVLFPSYFWHGTQAFQEGDTRLTVAFDIVPN